MSLFPRLPTPVQTDGDSWAEWPVPSRKGCVYAVLIIRFNIIDNSCHLIINETPDRQMFRQVLPMLYLFSNPIIDFFKKEKENLWKKLDRIGLILTNRNEHKSTELTTPHLHHYRATHTQQRLETGSQSGLLFLPVLSPSSFPFSLLIPLLLSLSPLSVKTVFQISSKNFLLADLIFMKDTHWS